MGPVYVSVMGKEMDEEVGMLRVCVCWRWEREVAGA